MIVKKTLPHASVPTVGIKDPSAREAVMKLNENIAALAVQVSDLQTRANSTDTQLESARKRIAALEAP